MKETVFTKRINVRSLLAAARHTLSPSLLAALGVLLVTGIALFTPPYIGMADNGDFFRALYGNGIFFSDPAYDSQYWGHFVREYGIMQYFNENEASLATSQSLLIRLTLLLAKLGGDGLVLDVRIQGAILALLLAGAVYLLVEALTWGAKGRYGYAVAGLAVFVFADTGYTAYFNSFYAEGLSYVMLLLLVAAWLLLYRGRYNDYVLLALFAFSAIGLTTSKQQNAPVGILVALVGILLLFLRRGRTYRTVAAAVLAVIMAAGAATYVWIPKEFVNINKYHAMTRGVLLHSPDPEGDLHFFGIDSQYALLKDTVYYDRYSPVDVNSKVMDEEFYSRFGFGSIAAFYATHPDRLLSMLDRAAENGFTIRPKAMGNYEISAGKPFQAKTGFFSSYSWLKEKLVPKTFGFIVLWALIMVGGYAPAALAAFRVRDVRRLQKPLLLAAVMGMGFMGIMVSVIGAGDADMAKHEFLFTAAFDAATFVAAADVLRRSLSAGSKAGKRSMRNSSKTVGKGAPA